MKKKYKKNNEINNILIEFYNKLYCINKKKYNLNNLLKKLYKFFIENYEKIIEIYNVNTYFINNILYYLDKQFLYKLKDSLEEIIKNKK